MAIAERGILERNNGNVARPYRWRDEAVMHRRQEVNAIDDASLGRDI
jgi:hypothetical protein